MPTTSSRQVSSESSADAGCKSGNTVPASEPAAAATAGSTDTSAVPIPPGLLCLPLILMQKNLSAKLV